ncbi:MAG: hypothetical protein M0032_08255 [Actinomycetota bacterium]|nr:hypothetical protein [Actinomycetota bacterium]
MTDQHIDDPGGIFGEDRTGSGLVLGPNVRIFFDSAGAIRLRTGIWNYEEAVVDLSSEPPEVASAVAALFGALEAGEAVEVTGAFADLPPVARANVEQLMEDLRQTRFVDRVDERRLRDQVSDALLGYWRPYDATEGGPPVAPIVLLGDDPAIEAEGTRLAEAMGVGLRVLPPDVYDVLAGADFTSAVDGYAQEQDFAAVVQTLSGAATVVGAFRSPHVALLRNLNRVLVAGSVRSVLGLVDGPFITVAGFGPPHTGCFECFEQRALARLEDHVSYHEFVRARPRPAAMDGITPVINLLLNLCLAEGLLCQSLGVSRFSGRVLHVYLPTIEIQVQDLLRMGSCPACGQVAQQRMAEMNFSTRAVIDRVVSDILV